MNWDEYFMSIARVVSSRSTDPSSKYGAVIVSRKHHVLSTGYNGLPTGVHQDLAYHSRPDKYFYWVHAEQNAIFQAALNGVRVEGATMYVLRPPCADCAKAIIQSGIIHVKYEEEHPPFDPEKFDYDNWRMGIEASAELFQKASIPCTRYEP